MCEKRGNGLKERGRNGGAGDKKEGPRGGEGGEGRNALLENEDSGRGVGGGDGDIAVHVVGRYIPGKKRQKGNDIREN